MPPSPVSPPPAALRVVLIDDEANARAVLRALLADHPEVEIAAEAETMAEARDLLARGDYDLVFLDIQLLGGNGFDLVPLVRPDAHIVFVTAFDQHAVRAFEVKALDYLVKPVTPARLARALARLEAGAADFPSRSSRPTKDDRVPIKLGAGSERLVRVGEIRFVASSENYTEIALGADGERLLVRRTLRAWEELLPPEHFVRVHRKMVVNALHALRLERVSDATSLLHLDGVADPVAVSYRYLAALRERWQR